MSETYIHETLPGMSKEEVLDSMSRDALVTHILSLAEIYQKIQIDLDEAADTLMNAYGVTVADVLLERETLNGATS